MLSVYGDLLSGNCYKVKLLLHRLERPHRWIHVDILKGETHAPGFLERNPNGKIPVLELEDGRFLFESNAILYFLAHGTPFLPADPWQRAQVLQWQSFEQYSHEPYIAVARYIAKYLGLPEQRRAEYESKRAGGEKALGVMEHHLEANRYFVGDTLTVADISLFAYTHVADEGGFDLHGYPAVRGWIARIQADPSHLGMAEAVAAGQGEQ